MKQRAQGGINAALLVAIIAGVIILYILFLPAGEKERLFDGDGKIKVGSGTKSGRVNYTTLLSEGPEEISPSEKLENRELPNVYLVRSVNAKELEKINSFSVRNGWFDKSTKTVQFALEDIGDIDNILLSFTAAKRQGNLLIKLNGVEVYNFQPDKPNVIIGIKKDSLQKINTMEFSVSPVGISFWTTNEYNLGDIKIIGDITDTSRQESRNIFELTRGEYNNLDRATLNFIPYCSGIKNIGILDVLVNDRNVYSAVPSCNDPIRVPIQSIVDAGENKVIFKTSEGSYSLEQIMVELKSKDVTSLTYFFELSDDQYNELNAKTKNANLTIEFVDDDELKKAEIRMNGRPFTKQLSQTEAEYNKQIASTSFVKKTNYLEIRPKTTLKIVRLEIVVWD